MSFALSTAPEDANTLLGVMKPKRAISEALEITVLRWLFIGRVI